jgi:glucokinase
MVAQSSTYLAIDVGHDRLVAGVVGDHGEVLVRDRVATPRRDVWPALNRLIRRVVAARPEDAGPLRACGVTCEGPLNRGSGTVDPLHMPMMHGFELRTRVHEVTRLPTVLASSSQGRVLAERWLGAARGVRDVMVLLLTDTVEAGIVSNGRLLGGQQGNAGQIGHVNVEPNGSPCVCGARGCLWAYVSGAALQAEMNRPLRRAPGPVVERAGVMVGRAIAGAAAVFDLRLVLLAGTVPAVFGAPFIEAATRELDQRSRVAHLRSLPDRARPLVQVGVAALGREGALVGAAGLGRLALNQTAQTAAKAPVRTPAPTPSSPQGG